MIGLSVSKEGSRTGGHTISPLKEVGRVACQTVVASGLASETVVSASLADNLVVWNVISSKEPVLTHAVSYLDVVHCLCE